MLPFVNMSGDAEQEYFSDGISEDLITDLSKISGLFVLARNSTFAYKGKPVDVRELSRRLSVRYVLEGSVRKAGARVRITAQLIDGEHGGHVWAERFDRELTDIFAVQDEITRNIVDALKVRLLPAERQALAGQPTTNVEAYQLYLRGRQFFHRHDKRSYAVARRLFERACAIDPLFARALAAIADCDAFLYLHSVSGRLAVGSWPPARAPWSCSPTCRRRTPRADWRFYVHGRFAEAEHEFETALRLDPNLFETWYFYGRAKFVEGDMAKAAELFERAAEIQPDDFQAHCLLHEHLPQPRPAGRQPCRRRGGAAAGASGSWSGIPTMRAPPISAATMLAALGEAAAGARMAVPGPGDRARRLPRALQRRLRPCAARRPRQRHRAAGARHAQRHRGNEELAAPATAISIRCGSIRASSRCFAGSKLSPERRARFRVCQRTVADAGRRRLWHFGVRA